MQITVNQPGARTIRDARPMIVDGQNVYVTVGAGTASLHIGGRIVAEQAADDMSTTAAQEWAVSYLADRDAAAAADWDAVDVTAAPAADVDEAKYADAVQSVRDAGALLDQHADKMRRNAKPGRYRHVSQMDGRVRFFNDTDPRHPINAWKTLKAQAARLMAWTAQDEAGYSRYVSDGLADTDGHFAPISRDAWKGTLGA